MFVMNNFTQPSTVAYEKVFACQHRTGLYSKKPSGNYLPKLFFYIVD